ncbi:cobalamin biosynthesis protein CbiG [Butyrivibrio sp. CB08]|uniref:cobalt-precorrin 5A hydrolase n=1 Tax=Butyrivibrio sp. CB08 TaxID=2364879 RepID=UPI000EAA6EAD|nr:cobalamin biosynthesis protein [Butyrivibrio sp. CB08]RKM59757.1 cobalamin biosynthesis protein CbiG [Butyrivibrio sp. CB08]
MEQISLGKYKLICFTDRGREVMERICQGLCELDGGRSSANDHTLEVAEVAGGLDDWTRDSFVTGNTLIFVGACGIAVRAIAPYVADKATDPGVLVIDENACYVIPVLSGHLGGAVDEAKKIAGILGAEAVLTTATDVRGEFAVDVFAKDNELVISDMKLAKEFTARLLATGNGTFVVDDEYKKEIVIGSVPESLSASKETCDIYISPAIYGGDKLQLIPKTIVIGMGCKKDKGSDELISFARKCLSEIGIDERAVKAVVSVDVKSKEQGLIDTARFFGAEFKTFSEEELSAVKGDFTGSDFVKATVGVDNVCERSVMAYGCSRIIKRKTSENGMTFAAGVIVKELRWR